jgi:hypothetical protein
LIDGCKSFDRVALPVEIIKRRYRIEHNIEPQYF